MMPDVPISLEAGARAPERATKDAAGYDLFAHEDAVIEPGETLLMSTGVRMAIPPGYEAQVRPRSGLSLRTQLRVANSPGTVDADYRGLVSVICENTVSLMDPEAYLLKHPELLDSFAHDYRPVSLSEYCRRKGHNGFTIGLGDKTLYLDREGHPLGTIYIKAGDRIAQLIFAKIELPEFLQVEDVTLIGNDRGGGFGSTGID